MRWWWWGLLCSRPTLWVGFLHSASSLKQKSADRHVAPLGHIIPIPSQPVFLFLLNAGRSTKYQLNSLGLEPTIYRTRGEHANDYTTDVIKKNLLEHCPCPWDVGRCPWWGWWFRPLFGWWGRCMCVWPGSCKHRAQPHGGRCTCCINVWRLGRCKKQDINK